MSTRDSSVLLAPPWPSSSRPRAGGRSLRFLRNTLVVAIESTPLSFDPRRTDQASWRTHEALYNA